MISEKVKLTTLTLGDLQVLSLQQPEALPGSPQSDHRSQHEPGHHHDEMTLMMMVTTMMLLVMVFIHQGHVQFMGKC